MNKNSMRGYTLLEILIALAVFAILATLTSSVMYQAFNTRARVNQQADKLNNLQLFIAILARDITQITTRATYDHEMHAFAALIGQANYVEFTRTGIVNPNSQALQSSLKRVAFLCQHNSFIRRTWQHLDALNHHHYQDKILLRNLEHCSFLYLNRNRDVLVEWREHAVQQNQKKEPLPVAIKLHFTLPDWGKLELLFIIPEALYVD